MDIPKKDERFENLLTALEKVITAHIKTTGTHPHICSMTHVHGKPHTTYLVQVVTKTSENGEVLGCVSFDQTTDGLGMTPPLSIQFGDTMKGRYIALELIEGNAIVWASTWKKYPDKPGVKTQYDMTKPHFNN